MDHGGVNQIIIDVMVVAMALGAADKCLGGRLGLGRTFDEGLQAMGVLALNMVGIICVAPLLGQALTGVVGPFYSLLGADSGMFAGTLLANDMGGYPLAVQMSASSEVAEFSGLILGSMLGVNIVFNIPVGLGMVRKDDIPAFAAGILCGLIAVPFGCVVGGLLAEYPWRLMAANLIPVMLASGLVALGLRLKPDWMVRAFKILGRVILVISTAAFALAIVERLTGVVVLPVLTPVGKGLEIVGEIAIVLAGAFTLVNILTRLGKPVLARLGERIGLDGASLAGMLASVATSVAMFPLIRDMKPRGKTVSVAFCACASACLGDHLGYTAAVAPHMIAPVTFAKLAGGFLAMVVALAITRSGRTF